MRKLIFFIAILFISLPCIGQTGLFIPKEFKSAYDRGTRSYDGLPGVNYWQNRSEYKIEVDLKIPDRILDGKEDVVYSNNSPDTIKVIVVRLYPDVLVKHKSRDWEVDEKTLNEGVNLKKVLIEGTEPDSSSISRRGTNLYLRLKKYVSPGEKIRLHFEWSFELPKVRYARSGVYDSTSWFVGYWYPQISVYDDIDRWDIKDFTGMTEFYNDFSDFDVKISSDFPDICIWATGVLQNAKELFNGDYLKKFEEAHKSDKIIKIITEKDLEEKNIIKKGTGKNIWHYKADNVPDFSFAFSDHYLWDAASYEAEPGRRVLINTVYNSKSKDFYEVEEIAISTIKYLSEDIPGVPYPYPAMTVYNGSGGMEFPMMVNDGSYEERIATIYVTSHEITHTYFPFYTGTNERKYAWMDEGFAVFIPEELQTRLSNEIFDMKAEHNSDYERVSGSMNDVPMMISSDNLKSFTYRIASYQKSAVAFAMLYDLLGKDLFLKCLQEFIKRWNGKHPTPYDFFFTFNNISGKNLDWFWKSWFFDFNYPDISIGNVSKENDIIKITLKNEGKRALPVELKITFTDGTEKIIHRTAEIWETGNDEYCIEEKSGKQIKEITLGSRYIPDINKENNIYKAE